VGGRGGEKVGGSLFKYILKRKNVPAQKREGNRGRKNWKLWIRNFLEEERERNGGCATEQDARRIRAGWKSKGERGFLRDEVKDSSRIFLGDFRQKRLKRVFLRSYLTVCT